MKKQIIDFNKILESNIYNLDNIYYDNIKVLNMNKAQLKRVYKKYGFTILLSKNNPKVPVKKIILFLTYVIIAMQIVEKIALFGKQEILHI